MQSIERSRRFLASSEWKRRDAVALLAGFVVCFALLATLSSVLPSAIATAIIAIMTALPGAYLALYFFRSLGRAVAFDVDGQRVVIDGGRGGAFSLESATLTLCNTPRGRALELASGNVTYRIGSMGDPLPATWRVPMIQEVDAEITQAEFEELLALTRIELQEAPSSYRVARRPSRC